MFYKLGDTQGAMTPYAKLSAAQMFIGAQGVTPVTLSDAASIVTDASLSNIFFVEMNGNRVLANPSAIVEGFVYTWIFTHSNRTLTYGSYFDFPEQEAFALSSGTSRVDMLTAVAYSTTRLICTGMADFR